MAAMALRMKLCTLLAGEEHHHDGYDFGILHADRSVPVSFPSFSYMVCFLTFPEKNLHKSSAI